MSNINLLSDYFFTFSLDLEMTFYKKPGSSICELTNTDVKDCSFLAKGFYYRSTSEVDVFNRKLLLENAQFILQSGSY